MSSSSYAHDAELAKLSDEVEDLRGELSDLRAEQEC